MKSEKSYSISIIIPCYNVAKYVDGIVDQLHKQTFKNWEAIFINDGSTDTTEDLLEKVIKEDNRFHLLSQNNKGVSAARNLGLKNAKGNYVYFLDADDLISNKLVEKIQESIKSSPDIILFSFKEQRSDQTIQLHKVYDLPPGKRIKLFLTNRIPIHLCSCVFNRKFLLSHNQKFNEETYYSEDREFITLSLMEAESVKIIPDYLYTYVYREGSAMRSRLYNYKKYSSILACERIYNRLKHSNLCSEALIHLKTTIFLHLLLLEKCKEIDINILVRLNEITQRYGNKPTPFVLYRDGFFCYIASKLWRWPQVFKWLGRLR